MPAHPTNQLFPTVWLDELDELDASWQGGDHVTASEVETALALWRERMNRPATPDEEWFDVVNATGNPFGWSAPRWFCHLTGLRHRVVYAFLTSPQGFLALQMRAHDKLEWPSTFDSTVGGHLKAGQDWRSGALVEIEEEVGLQADAIDLWLVGGALHAVDAPYERSGRDRGTPPYRNRQVNRIYAGELTAWGLANLRFADGEVSGVFLCHPREVQRMIEVDFLIAPGLRNAFGIWQAWATTAT